MNKNKPMRSKHPIRIATLYGLLSSTLAAAPPGTAFTYQGKLTNGGVPANGICDFRFILHDVAAGGSQAGPILTNAAVKVSGGLFTTMLDFSSGVFADNARWLEIGVRTNGGGGFTTLSPRQPLSPAPHARYSPSTGTAVSVTTATTAASVSGIVAASQLTGTVANARLSAKVALRSGGNPFSGALVFAADGLRMSDQEIYFRSPADSSHGLGWYGAGRQFAGVIVNGPVLHGNGGALGARAGTTNVALQWDDARNITIAGTLNASGPVQFGTSAFLINKDLFLRGDRNPGVGWYGIGKPFAGVSLDGPVLYGWSGGGLGTFRGGVATNLALTWDASGKVGIGKTNPATALDVNGTVTATAFSNLGAGLTGSLIWAQSSNVTSTIIPSAPANIWTKTADLLTYTKLLEGPLEVTYNGRLQVGASSCPVGITFELTVDDHSGTTAQATDEVLAGETSVPVSITGIFTGVSAGTHRINVGSPAGRYCRQGRRRFPGRVVQPGHQRVQIAAPVSAAELSWAMAESVDVNG